MNKAWKYTRWAMAALLAVCGAVGLTRSRELLQWLLAADAWLMAILIICMED